MSRVLFVCVANAGRSLIAERLFRQAAAGRHEARSAGSQPGSAPHPLVVEALREQGVDVADRRPCPLDQALLDWADVVVATCDEACPALSGTRYLRWQLADPQGRPLAEVRAVRDEIAARVAELVRELDRAAELTSR